MRSEFGSVVEAVTQALTDEPRGLTTVQIAEHIGCHRDNIARVLSRMNDSTPRFRRRVHIVRWDHLEIGQRSYPRPVWRLGDRKNAPKPPPKTRAAVVSAWYAKRANLLRMNSVFNMGRSVR